MFMSAPACAKATKILSLSYGIYPKDKWSGPEPLKRIERGYYYL
jgi:hypothetical protein